MKVEAGHIKQMTSLKGAFVRLTNCDSWVTAEQKYPHFATTQQLRKFAHLDFKKAIPTSFTDFCTRAKASETTNEIPPENIMFSFESMKAHVIEANMSTLSGNVLRKSDPNFCGANLSILEIKEVHCVLSLDLRHHGNLEMGLG